MQANLKRYRAAVLKAACEGRLVETEAALARIEKRPYEPAAELLQRILRERRARWEADQLAKMEAAGKPPKDDKWKARYDEPAAPKTKDLPQLPEGWVWCSAEQCTTQITDGEHITPKRAKAGILLLSARNIQNGWLSLDKVDFVPEQVYEQISKRLTINAGDVLLSCSGTVGRSCVAPENLRFALVRSVAVLKPLFEMGKFLSLMIRSPFLQLQIDERKTQTAQANIFQAQIKKLVFPLPPIVEQQRIVAEAERQFSIIDGLEQSSTTGIRRTETLRQKVLQDAFTGKLVEQDPQDEPASDLLKRIKAERIRREAEERDQRKEKTKTVKKTGKTATGERRKLVEVLREAERPLAPEVLFREAGFKPEDVEAFYEELKQADKDELITEDKRSNGDVYLSARA